MKNNKPIMRQAFNKTLIAAACAGLCMSTANAQDIDDTGILEEVVVYGFAKSLLDAIETKRVANSVIESISAEDIGKLPDISLLQIRSPAYLVFQLNVLLDKLAESIFVASMKT